MLLHKKYFVLAVSLLLVSNLTFGQKQKKESNKGKMFIYWGWNRANYSDSDIHFKGNNYDFTLSDVKARDKVTPFSFYDYFNPSRITIPQTNFRIGFFLSDHYTVSVGVDHMKYVMKSYQTVKINGTIATGGNFDGNYTNDDILLTHDFLQFEHTDGLNYINVELKRFDDVSHWLGLSSSNFVVNLTEGFGGGVLYPKTNAKLFEQERHDEFHLSGWGVSAGIGVNITIFKYFFIQSDMKVGYIDMPNIRTTINEIDLASQKFTFFERSILFGVKFNILNSK